MINKVFLLSFFITLSFFIISAPSVSADGSVYYMSAGEAVDLKWDSQNVWNCRAANSYYTTAWGSSNYGSSYTLWAAAPANFGKYSFSKNVLANPGSYKFRFNCQDDEDNDRFFEDEQLIIYPLAPSGLNNNSCVSGSRKLSWSPVNQATSYIVRVTKPAGESCSGTGGTWTQLDSTTCQVITTNTEVTFEVKSSALYSWRVASRAGSLVSANTNKGTYISENYTGGTSFSCTVSASVDIFFKD